MKKSDVRELSRGWAARIVRPCLSPMSLVAAVFISCHAGDVAADESVSQETAGEVLTQQEMLEQYRLQVATTVNRLKEALSGRWVMMNEAQKVLDKHLNQPISESEPAAVFECQFLPLDEFLQDLDEHRETVQRLAEASGHELVASGMMACYVPNKPRAGLMANFLMTYKEGETFLCVINYSTGGFHPRRVHLLSGAKRSEDVLLLELGWESHEKHVAVFRFESEAPEGAGETQKSAAPAFP